MSVQQLLRLHVVHKKEFVFRSRIGCNTVIFKLFVWKTQLNMWPARKRKVFNLKTSENLCRLLDRDFCWVLYGQNNNIKNHRKILARVNTFSLIRFTCTRYPVTMKQFVIELMWIWILKISKRLGLNISCLCSPHIRYDIVWHNIFHLYLLRKMQFKNNFHCILIHAQLYN